MNVYGKLAKCRVELQEAKLKKSGQNKYAGFSYFELSDFLPTANKIFDKNGLCPIFNIFGDKAVLNIFNVERPEEVITFESKIANLELKGCNAIQALGGTITYMRRYLYMNALEIVENDSFDAVTGQNEKKEKVIKIAEKQEEKFADAGQKDNLKKIIGNAEFAKVMNACGGRLTLAKYEELINEPKSV